MLEQTTVKLGRDDKALVVRFTAQSEDGFNDISFEILEQADDLTAKVADGIGFVFKCKTVEVDIRSFMYPDIDPRIMYLKGIDTTMNDRVVKWTACNKDDSKLRIKDWVSALKEFEERGGFST